MLVFCCCGAFTGSPDCSISHGEVVPITSVTSSKDTWSQPHLELEMMDAVTMRIMSNK